MIDRVRAVAVDTLGTLMTAAVLILCAAGPAMAQEDPARDVKITFDLGEYSLSFTDWMVGAVEVSGDLVVGEPVTVILWGADDRELWTGTQPYERPVTRFAVDRPIAVGAVVEAGAWQGLPTAVAGIVIGGELDQRPPGAAAEASPEEPELAVAPPTTTDVEGAQVVRPRVTWSAAGGGAGRGQLALSMVLAVIIVAVLFRSPLPSASSERWTR